MKVYKRPVSVFGGYLRERYETGADVAATRRPGFLAVGDCSVEEGTMLQAAVREVKEGGDTIDVAAERLTLIDC